MLNKKQRNFRKQMKEAKKQAGAAYHENYDKYTPDRPVRSRRVVDFSGVIRAFLYLAIVGSMVYKSGMITPIIESQGAVGYDSSQRPRGLPAIGTPLLGKKEQACSDYLQLTSVVSQELSQVIEDYVKEKTDIETSNERLSEIWENLNEIEAIKHGDVLRKTVVENLTQSLQYINQIEELRVTRNVRTEAERLSWYERKGAVDQLHVQLNNIAYRQMEDIKELLQRYDMGYVEEETGIEYYYQKGDSSL